MRNECPVTPPPSLLLEEERIRLGLSARPGPQCFAFALPLLISSASYCLFFYCHCARQLFFLDFWQILPDLQLTLDSDFLNSGRSLSCLPLSLHLIGRTLLRADFSHLSGNGSKVIFSPLNELPRPHRSTPAYQLFDELPWTTPAFSSSWRSEQPFTYLKLFPGPPGWSCRDRSVTNTPTIGFPTDLAADPIPLLLD